MRMGCIDISGMLKGSCEIMQSSW
uniref:Uncharacterized protein n=1 Tax=Rhizophora mucronata TaxID=61149 RepID=A0A2P2JFL5_RHIMU